MQNAVRELHVLHELPGLPEPTRGYKVGGICDPDAEGDAPRTTIPWGPNALIAALGADEDNTKLPARDLLNLMGEFNQGCCCPNGCVPDCCDLCCCCGCAFGKILTKLDQPAAFGDPLLLR